MSDRQRTILDTLRFGKTTTHQLAAILSAPEASVRRDIQALRKQGWRIYNDGSIYELSTTQDGSVVAGAQV